MNKTYHQYPCNVKMCQSVCVFTCWLITSSLFSLRCVRSHSVARDDGSIRNGQATLLSTERQQRSLFQLIRDSLTQEEAQLLRRRSFVCCCRAYRRPSASLQAKKQSPRPFLSSGARLFHGLLLKDSLHLLYTRLFVSSSIIFSYTVYW